jgi:hypothetical protein
MNLDGDALDCVIAGESNTSVAVRPAGQCYLGLMSNSWDRPAVLAFLTPERLGAVTVALAHC